MSRRRKPGGNSSLDVVQRLQQRVSEGEFYEALQLYKTSYSRLKAQGRLDDAEELLTAGAIAMSKENEVRRGLPSVVHVMAESFVCWCRLCVCGRCALGSFSQFIFQAVHQKTLGRTNTSASTTTKAKKVYCYALPHVYT